MDDLESPEDRRLAWWVEKACRTSLPVLSVTLGEIERALSNEEYSAFSLARVILQDPPLTTKVLRVANSVFYNPSGRPISMVSRAVMIVGFDAVRSICTSISIIEALLADNTRDRLLDEIAQALHAAVIARHLARARQDPAPEEVFVSTLLGRLGHMVFWSLGGPEVDAYDDALLQGEVPGDELERRIVGVPLQRLTDALGTRWHLPVGSGEEGQPPSRREIETVAMSVAREAVHGWPSGGLKPPLREVAWLLSIDEARALEILRKLSREAVDYARALGSHEVARRIPEHRTATVEERFDDPSAMGEPDTTTELHVLQEITANLMDRLDVNSILQMILEGIHRGVGMDRTALAFVDPRSGEVRTKIVLGVHRRQFEQGFAFSLHPHIPHSLSDLVQRNGSGLVDPSRTDVEGTFDHPLYALFAGRPFLAQAVSVNGHPLGVFVADRHSSGRPIDRATMDNFRLLCHHANIALAMAASQRGT